jgi:hypothetical protein
LAQGPDEKFGLLGFTVGCMAFSSNVKLAQKEHEK